MVKPNAKFGKVVNDNEKSFQYFGKNDFVVLMAGSNDIFCNEVVEILNGFEKCLGKLSNTNVIVAEFPLRYDLEDWPCVNLEITKSNIKLREICKTFQNIRIVGISTSSRISYIIHGKHLNEIGKNNASKNIVERIMSAINRPNYQTLIDHGNYVLG